MGGGPTFFSTLFWRGDFFLRIILRTFFFAKVTLHKTVVGEQQQHKGMFLKHGKKFPTVHIRDGGGGLFFSPIDFADPLHPTGHK